MKKKTTATAPKQRRKKPAKPEPSPLEKDLREMLKQYPPYAVLSVLREIQPDVEQDELDKKWWKEEVIATASSFGYEVIESTGSLAELEKIEAFRESLLSNPYQLSLVA